MFLWCYLLKSHFVIFNICALLLSTATVLTMRDAALSINKGLHDGFSAEWFRQSFYLQQNVRATYGHGEGAGR